MKIIIILTQGLLLFFLMSSGPCLWAEMYHYRAEDGSIIITDDPSEIPDNQRGTLKKYKGKYEGLKPEEVEALKAKEKALELQREVEAARMREEWQRKKAEEELAARKKKQEELRKKLETKVSIRGNQVIVPVSINYKGQKKDINLLLDTGATITTLHRDVAESFDIKEYQQAEARVASGKSVNFIITEFDTLTLGPFTFEKVPVGILGKGGKGNSANGLLGMNVLRYLNYRIDFENEIIKWEPR